MAYPRGQHRLRLYRNEHPERTSGASDRPYPDHRNPAGDASFCRSVSAAFGNRALQMSEYPDSLVSITTKENVLES